MRASLLRDLGRVAHTKSSIAKLRRLIFNLAIRGRLVLQDFADEPVDELIRRIHLAKSGSRLRAAQRLAGGEAKPLFPVPPTWRWVRLGDVVVNRDGERIPVSKEERAIRAKKYPYYGASGVIDMIDGFLFEKPLLLIGEDGANLVNRSTPIAFMARGRYWVNNHAHVLDAISEDLLRYIELYINAIDLKPYVTGTAQPKMNQAKMNSIPIAFPPLEEQHRILTKVDEMMALCDELEQSLAAEQTERGRLLEALLHDASEGCRRDGDDNGCRDGGRDAVERAISLDQGEQSRPRAATGTIARPVDLGPTKRFLARCSLLDDHSGRS